jgi:hypothetical protein
MMVAPYFSIQSFNSYVNTVQSNFLCSFHRKISLNNLASHIGAYKLVLNPRFMVVWVQPEKFIMEVSIYIQVYRPVG